jgi:hypothetical protein
MASEEFEFGDVFAGEDFDSDAAKREAHRFLDDWTDNDVSAASDRTRRLAILGAAGLLAAALVPTTTVLAGRIMDAVFYGLLVEVGVMASVHYLFRGVDRPREVLERDINGVRTVGLIVLLAMAYAATNVRAGRLLWRYVFKSAAFAPGNRPPRFRADGTPPLVTWGRRLVVTAAVIVVADVTWYVLTRTGAGPRLFEAVSAGDTGVGWSFDPATDRSTLEVVALYAVVFLVGVLVAITVSVRR